MKLLQQTSSIYGIFRISLLEPYICDRCTVPEPPQPIKIASAEEYKLMVNPQSKYRYSTLRYCTKYKGYLVDQSELLLVENFAHVQDLDCKFHASHLNQPKTVG